MFMSEMSRTKVKTKNNVDSFECTGLVSSLIIFEVVTVSALAFNAIVQVVAPLST